MATSDARTESTFPFMKLPGEIRNRIYEICLGADEIHIHRSCSTGRPCQICLPPSHFATVSTFFSPQLLRTSRQIHEETHKILYTRPIFLFIHINPLTFLEQIGREISSIDKMAWYWDSQLPDCGYDITTNIDWIVRAQALKELHLTVLWPGNSIPEEFKKSVLQFFNSAKDWLLSRWKQTGSVEAALEIFKLKSWEMDEAATAQVFIGTMREQLTKCILEPITD